MGFFEQGQLGRGTPSSIRVLPFYLLFQIDYLGATDAAHLDGRWFASYVTSDCEMAPRLGAGTSFALFNLLAPSHPLDWSAPRMGKAAGSNEAPVPCGS